jgi:hypothetical protein
LAKAGAHVRIEALLWPGARFMEGERFFAYRVSFQMAGKGVKYLISLNKRTWRNW